MMGPLVIFMVDFLAETVIVGWVLETAEDRDRDRPEAGAVVVILMILIVYLAVVPEVPELKITGVVPQETTITIGL